MDLGLGGRAEVLAKLARMERLHGEGMSIKVAAVKIGISETRLHRWRKDPRFRQ